jgi:Fic family protein
VHELSPALSEWERFVHGGSEFPALLKIGLAHAQFETIHPFLDGNGRVGRLLITFLLCERKILQKPVLYLSHYFRANRSRYYDLLQNIRDNGDWEAWLKFFLKGINDVAEEATATARRIVGLRETHRRVILDQFGRTAGNALQVLETLYSRPIVSVNEIAELLELSYPAANDLTRQFTKSGLLKEITGQSRHRRFRYDAYVALFTPE